jgi:hypothetical protein
MRFNESYTALLLGYLHRMHALSAHEAHLSLILR